MGRHDSDCGNGATLKRAPLHRKKLRPDPEKVYDLERFKACFPAISRNFAAQNPHIRQGLSSEQFGARGDASPPSWPGLAVRRTASLSLACVPAIHILAARYEERGCPGQARA